MTDFLRGSWFGPGRAMTFPFGSFTATVTFSAVTSPAFFYFYAHAV